MSKTGKVKEREYLAAIKGMRGIRRILVVFLTALFLVFLGKSAYYAGFELFCESSMTGEPGVNVMVEIPEGATASDIGGILKERGLVKSRIVFVMQERLSDHHGKLKAGTYRLNTSMKPSRMMAIMAGEAEGTDDGS